MTTIEKCKDLVAAEMKKVLGSTSLEEFYGPIRKHIFAGGKRVRPVFCLLAAEACGEKIETALPVASAIELVQSFSLVHDDIIDRDDMRRGLPTMWKSYGDGAALNMGDGMFTKCLEALSNYRGKNMNEVLRIFSNGVMDMCEGQALDIMFESRESITIDDYSKMSTLKTGSFLGASLKLGALVANAESRVQESLYQGGKKLGLGYQIWDDYIDFASDETGKTYGSDIKKGKKTLIVCHALQKLRQKERGELLSILKTSVEATTNDMIGKAVEILDSAGSIDYAKDYARRLVAEAKESFKVLPDCEAKKEILKLVDFTVNRVV